MKLAIIGSRTFSDYDLLSETIHSHFWSRNFDGPDIGEIISGGARGADENAARWAKEHGIKLTEILPDYKFYPPKLAPLIRNEEIVKAADFVLAFWTGELRSGTANALRHARVHRKPTMIVYFTP